MSRSLLIGVFAVGLVVGGFSYEFIHTHSCPEYGLVNPDFSCGNKPVISKASYVTLVNDLRGHLAELVDKGELKEGAVFFRDLEGGPTFNLNANTPFVPASLMKLPLVFAYYRLAEDKPEILGEMIVYSPQTLHLVSTSTAIEESKSPLVEGESYTIEELLGYTVTHSDNLASYLLVEHMNLKVSDGGNELMRTFQDLGIIDPRDPNEQVVTVRNYASLFRQLYNVSYLSPEHSEAILELLAASTYSRGLEAGVPEGVEVAHKFGERYLPDGSKQLHDCGIVYYPENPYELCVMTRGDDWGELQGAIATVSKMVYQEVDSRRL